MPESSTRTCRFSNHREVRFSFDERSGFDPDWLIDYLEQQVAAGTRFESGETIQIGWFLAKLHLANDGALEIWEPDFLGIPMTWRTGIDTLIRQLILQKSLCDALHCEPDFPSMQQAGILSPEFPLGSEFIMSRDPASSSDSGWVFHEVDYAGTFGEFSSLYQIALFNADSIPYLALPHGSRVTRRTRHVEVSHGTHAITSNENELLRCLAQS